MAATRIRRNVWTLAPWDATLIWYARAIAVMQARPITDPASWRFQAAIHGFGDATGPGPLPAPAIRNRFWNQCQHGSWFFLPWHRMYLLYFEQIVADAVVSLGGPAEWSLPYWNYSDATNPNARRLPPAFREPSLPDGTANPLRVSSRDRGNSGGLVATPDFVDVSCLDNSSFAAQPAGGDMGFGGPQTLFEHGGGDIGELERTPHGAMHVAVGGFMGAFETAALDPIFWLHHANIDRLWTVWRQMDPTRVNPANTQWLTGVSFEFNDGRGGIVSHTSSEMVESTAAPLNYQYDDLSDPRAGGLESVPVRRPPVSDRVPEMIGATDKPVVLRGRTAETSLAVRAPAGPGLEALESATPPRIYLNVENITGEGKAASYRVYINLPEGALPEDHSERYAGLLPMFGVAEATRNDQQRSGSGLRYSFEISAIVQALSARNEWDPANLRLTFVPVEYGAEEGLESAAPATTPVQVGRVSLYLS